MYQQQYKCTLLTNLVLTGNSATEGFSASLDYIPGAKFLGLIASEKYYKAALELGHAMDFFHNGSVRFGDAYPLIKDPLKEEEEMAYKKPFSWLKVKGGGINPIYLHHSTSRTFREELINNKDKSIKLEQVKKGYFTKDKSLKLTEQFAIKSAYNQATLRSKEGQMYGYFSLERGTVWTFTISSNNKDYLDIIHPMLSGKKRIGRSKSAEYGMVRIEAMDKLASVDTFTANTHAYLYAASNLCFYDQYGHCKTHPTETDLGLPEEVKIDWEKSQIKTRSYRTWNQKRQNRNADRTIIVRGSVIAIKLNGASLDSEIFKDNVGAHQSEGFGNLLLNPWFLKDATPQLKVQLEKFAFEPLDNAYGMEKDSSDAAVLTFVKKKKETAKRLLDIDQLVNKFRNDYDDKFAGVSASQWGQLRRYAKKMSVEAYRKLVFDKDIGFLYSGRMESTWRKEDRRTILENYLFDSGKIPRTSVLEFVMKLAAQIAKNKA